MAFQLRDFEKQADEDDVVLVHLPSAREARFSLYESRVLPFIEGAEDEADVVARAAAGRLKITAEHARAVIHRLETAGILSGDSEEHTPTSGAPLSIVRPAMNAAAPAGPAASPAEPEEVPAVKDDRGQENLRRELRRMNKPLEYAPIPVVQSRQPAVRAPAAYVPPAQPVETVVDLPNDLPETERGEPDTAAAPEQPRDDRPLPTAASFRAAEQAAAANAPVRPAVPAGPPWHKVHRRGLKWTALALALGVGALAVPLPTTLAVPSHVVPFEATELRAPADGVVELAAFAPGAEVKAGDVLVRLRSPELLERVAAMEQQLATDTSLLALLQAGDRPDVKRQEALIDERSAAARAAIAEYNRMQAQLAAGKATQAETMESEVKLIAAKRALVEAHTKLGDLKALDLPAEIRGRAQLLDRSRAKVAEAQAKIAALEVKAPKGGTLVALPVAGAVGAKVKEGDLLAEVGEVKQMRLLLRIREEQAPYLSSGKPFEFTLNHGETQSLSLQKLGFTGEVTAEGRYYRVEAVVDNASRRLRSGMGGVLEVPAGFSSLIQRRLNR